MNSGGPRYLMAEELQWDVQGGAAKRNDFWPSVRSADKTPSAAPGQLGPGQPFLLPPPPGPPMPAPAPPAPAPAPGPSQPARLDVRGVKLVGRQILRISLRSAVQGNLQAVLMRKVKGKLMEVTRFRKSVRITEQRRLVNAALKRPPPRDRRYTVRVVVATGGKQAGADSALLRVGK